MRRLALLTIALLLAACSGPQTRDDAPDDRPDPDGPPAYETFDPSPYDRAPTAASDREIDHDVPAVLMEGRVEPPEPEGPRYVQGYRIQVFSSPDKGAADRVADQIAGWWRTVRSDPDVPSSLVENVSPEVLYLEPYYRVRMGRFEYRDGAEAALAFVRQRFADAFIMPERIRVDG